MKQVEASLPQPIDSSTEFEPLDLQAKEEFAAERARMLFGSYRKGDANDPDTYVAAVAAILADYDDDVIVRVTDPRTGIARKLKFMPNPAEVADECDHAKKVIAGERLIAERRAAGCEWVDDRANGKFGFYDANGNQHGAQRQLPSRPIGQERVAPVINGLSLPLMDEGKAHVPMDDGGHYRRIAADLDARRARSVTLSTGEAEQKQGEG
jgi:hypothetical protein